MQETNEYADLEDQQLQTTTSGEVEEVRLQSSDTNEGQSIISFFIKQEEEASKSTGIDIQ